MRDGLFETRDTNLASYFLAMGHRLVGLTGPKQSRTFQFEGVTEADRLAYYQDAPIGARKLFESYHTIKGLLFTEQRA